MSSFSAHPWCLFYVPYWDKSQERPESNNGLYIVPWFLMKVLWQMYNQIITSNSWLTLSAVFAEVSIKNMPLLSAYACASCNHDQNQSLRTNPWRQIQYFTTKVQQKSSSTHTEFAWKRKECLLHEKLHVLIQGRLYFQLTPLQYLGYHAFATPVITRWKPSHISVFPPQSFSHPPQQEN